MTKYFLNSGSVRKYPERAKKFFAAITENLGVKPKILLCLFAVPREEWDTRYNRFIEQTREFFPSDVEPVFELAQPKIFAEQVAGVDALYMFGGDTHLALFWLSQLDAPKVWEGKVVATNSATSHALSAYGWSCDWRDIFPGLGIIPIKFIAHYKSNFGADEPRGPIDWAQAYRDTEAIHPEIPTYALEEGEYVVFEK